MIYEHEEHEDEEYQRIEDFPYYFISNYGKIKRLFPIQPRSKGNRVYQNMNGDLIVTLTRGVNDTKYVCRIDRLVAEAFLPPPENPEWEHVRHIDGDKKNCHVDNLEWW